MLLIFNTCWLSILQAQPLPLRWLDLTNTVLEVNGLPWYSENGAEMFRQPRRLEEQFRPPVWNLAKLVDGTPPNDLGFQWMAEGLASRLRKLLALTPR